MQNHLRHAADVDVVDDLGIVILGHGDDAVDVVRPIDESAQHDAGRGRADRDRGAGEFRPQQLGQFPRVAVNADVDRVRRGCLRPTA